MDVDEVDAPDAEAEATETDREPDESAGSWETLDRDSATEAAEYVRRMYLCTTSRDATRHPPSARP